jgi:hypothetical protein
MKYVNYKTINKLTDDINNSPELYINKIQTEGVFMNEQLEERLWNFIDGTVDATEKSAIEQLIATNLEWKNKYHELLEVHQLMSSSELEAPSMRFTKNVMEDIAKYHVAPATRSYINKNIIRGIGGFFVVMILGFLIYGFSQISWANTGSENIIPAFNISKKIDFSKFYNPTYASIFIMINVVLGLMLLDLVLEKRKENFKQKQS